MACVMQDWQKVEAKDGGALYSHTHEGELPDPSTVLRPLARQCRFLVFPLLSQLRH